MSLVVSCGPRSDFSSVETDNATPPFALPDRGELQNEEWLLGKSRCVHLVRNLHARRILLGKFSGFAVPLAWSSRVYSSCGLLICGYSSSYCVASGLFVFSLGESGIAWRIGGPFVG